MNVLASGPAAAPAAALHFARAIGTDLITVDMGGTSLDVCLIRDGRAAMSRDVHVEGQPIGVPAVEVHSVGAGGGSIAWIDAGGALRVGPRSAGARPGPACYGFGGAEPTVTDANVVLGYLDPAAFLGGRRVLRDDLSRAAVDEHVAGALGLSTIEAAAGIVRIVNANMVAAIRAVSVERGIDPRGFTLMCGGGAGGLHCAELARELGARRVFVPLEAGVFCSLGMTVTDIRHDHVLAFHAVSDDADVGRLNGLLRDLAATARAELAEEGVPAERTVVQRTVDARYPGQHREIMIALPPGDLGEDDLRSLEAAFHAEHETQYAYARPGLPVEFLHWRITAVAHQRRDEQAVETPDAHEAVAARSRMAYFDGTGMVETAFHDVADLTPGSVVRGPAVLCAPTTTVVLPPGDVLTMSSRDGYTIDVRPKAALHTPLTRR